MMAIMKQWLWWWHYPRAHVYLWPRLYFTSDVSPPWQKSAAKPWHRRLHWMWKP